MLISELNNSEEGKKKNIVLISDLNIFFPIRDEKSRGKKLVFFSEPHDFFFTIHKEGK